jgi:hypothetical protein
MKGIELRQKWLGLLKNPVISGFRSLRISADCICELYLGVSKEGNRCLILSLPSNKHLNFKGIQRENLSIEYFREKNLIVLQLADSDFNDLFDDLILSLYHGIMGISQVNEYSEYFIQSFYRWSEFFEDRKSDLLSEGVIKGIIGELLVLKLLITTTGRPEVNFLLKAWTGLYDRGNDFELETKNIEVKSKSPSGIDVIISSEYQLEVSQGKGLELFVVSLLSDFTFGINIGDLIYEIKNLVQDYSGDTVILWKALSQKNITAKNVSQYNRYRFKPVNWISYNCADEAFPKLNRSNIPEEISGLKYVLRTNLLTSFIIEQSEF